jgi:pimeloyl-ACP methyl ester carboxylesterase
MLKHARSFLVSVVLAAFLGLPIVVLVGHSQVGQSSEDPERSPQSRAAVGAAGHFAIVFQDQTYDFELRRVLGYAVSGGTDINECLYTAQRIKEGDDESWYTEWRATADRIRTIGEESLAAGHKVSAREAFLRASNYYRTAEFFLRANLNDPRLISTWRLSRDSFRKAAALMDQPVETVRIPYEGTSLPGYIMKPDGSRMPRKTLIVHTGFDGTGEELYFEVAFFALRRGYNVLIFEGPGQGGALHEQGLHFRGDWEKVVTPVVDFALTRPEFDRKRLALLGISMGGYLAPRAAAFEHRLAAVIANPGVYDAFNGRGAMPREQLQEVAAQPDETNRFLREEMAKNSGLRWHLQQGMFSFGKKSPLDFLLALSEYHLDGAVQHIKSPTLVIVSETDHFLTVEAQMKLYNLLTGPKTLMRFTAAEMAGEHCQMGAVSLSNQRILDWLDETLAK